MRSSIAALVLVLAAEGGLATVRVSAAHQSPASAGIQGAPTSDAAALRAQGESAMEASRFGDAEAIYLKLVGATPADPIAHMQLGMARAMGGKTADAIGPLREALRLRPDLLPAKLFLGISYMELGHPKEAVGPLRQVVQADKDNPNARQALAEALLTLEQFAEASTQLEALVVSQPQSPQVWAALGRSYEGVAREAFAKLQALDIDSPYVWLLAADVMTIEEKYPQAFSLIRKAQVALPTLPGVHHTLARVYGASGHADWAAVEQKRAEQERPSCDTVPVACAYLTGKLEDVIARTGSASQPAALYWRARAANDLAARSFETLEKLPPSVERYVVRAGIARDQNQPLEAARQLREALKLAPGDPGIERELAGALYAARDFEGALPLLEKLYGLAPDAPDLQVALGEALLQAQQVDRAVGLLTKAVAADPSMLQARASLGRALVQSGAFEEAIPHLEKALAGDVDGSVHYQLAQAMQRTGKPDRAKALLAEYQKRSQAAAPASATTSPDVPAITPPVP
ncbi:tetratricopeptide repeat protein [Luteitalea pratensis]|uniref:tetratricopeptide repeat protein n=1 Tax=Luteitalea pratensis TaxID=1855912 RepID=UPI000D73F728|nr:tetratricopeptide repeat protein [Luteitalea pratensis]